MGGPGMRGGFPGMRGWAQGGGTCIPPCGCMTSAGFGPHCIRGGREGSMDNTQE